MKYIYPQKNKNKFVTQAFTTIEAGNMSYTRDNNPENVRKRYLEISEEFGIDPERIVTLKQVHGTDVFVVGDDFVGNENQNNIYDAAITSQSSICLCTVHADCVPIYFVDSENKCIGLAHSGWKGTYQGICLNVIKSMNEIYGTKIENVYVTIGPSICMNCFEVQNDVFSLFNEKYPQYKEYITETNINLKGIIKSTLVDAGVYMENIHDMELCTCCNEELFFSHRRATKSNIKNSGAMAAFTFMRG